MRRIKHPQLLEATDRALARIRRHDSASEARLLDSRFRLTHDVATLDRVVERNRLWLVDRAAQLAGGDDDHPCSWVVGAHVRGEDRLVPARPGREEVDERHPKLVSSPKCTVVGLVDVAGSVRIEESVGRYCLRIRRVGGSLDRQRGRPALRRCAIDPLLPVQERDASATERKALTQRAYVWNLRTPLGLEHREMRHARGADIFVSQHLDYRAMAREKR